MNNSPLYLSVILQTGALSLAIVFDSYYFLIALAVFIVSDIMIYLVTPKETPHFTVFLISYPTLSFLLVTLCVLLFVEHAFVRMSLIVIHALLQAHYLFHLSRFLSGVDELSRVLAHRSSSVLLLAQYYFFAASLFALHYYLDAPFWITFPLFFTVTALNISHAFWSQRIQFNAFSGVLLVTLVMACELFLVIRWLPDAYEVQAFLLTAGYYILMLLIKTEGRESLSSRRLYGTITFVVFLVLLLLYTTEWR